MLNPMAIQLAAYIGERVGHLLIDQEKNVLTLEDLTGNRYLVTVESMFTPTTETKPLPTLDTSPAATDPQPTTQESES